jgi:phage terminase small subunit
MKSIDLLINYINSIEDKNHVELFKEAYQLYANELNQSYDKGSIETYNYWMNKINPNRIKDKVTTPSSSNGLS